MKTVETSRESSPDDVIMDFDRCGNLPSWGGLMKRCYCCIMGNVGSSVSGAFPIIRSQSQDIEACHFNFFHSFNKTIDPKFLHFIKLQYQSAGLLL